MDNPELDEIARMMGIDTTDARTFTFRSSKAAPNYYPDVRIEYSFDGDQWHYNITGPQDQVEALVAEFQAIQQASSPTTPPR